MTKKNTLSNTSVFFIKNSIRTFFIYMAIIFAVNFIVFLIINNLNFIHYQTNDDYILQNLINGSMGGYYYELPSTNFLLLKFLSGLYLITNAVNWYGLFELSILFLTASFVGAVFMDKYGPKWGFILYLLTIPIYFGLFLTQFQFTIISYSLLAASIAGIIYAFFVDKKGTRLFLYVFSVCLFVLAVLFRDEVLVSAAAFFGIIALFLLIYYKKKALKLVLVVTIAFLLCGGAFLLQNSYYNSSQELKDYNQYYTARVELVDRVPLTYDSNPDAFKMVGWSRNDSNFIRGYTFPDDEKFSMANLQTIAAARSNTQYMTDPNAIASNLFSTFTEINIYMLIGLFTIFLLAFFSGKRKLLSVFLLLLPFAIHILLIIVGRPIFRAVYPHYILSIIALLAICDFGNLKTRLGYAGRILKESKMVTRTISASLIVVFAVGMANIFLYSKWDGDTVSKNMITQERKEAFDYFNENQNNVYLYSVSSRLESPNESYSIFSIFPKNYFVNNRLFGGWDTRSPSYNDFKERNGLSSLPRDFLKDNVYYVSGPSNVHNASGISLDELTTYFKENYDIPIQYQIVKQVGNEIFVYKIEQTDAAHMGQVLPALQPAN